MSKHERSSSQDDALRHPSTKRAKEVDQHTPMSELDSLLSDEKSNNATPRNVLHWFRSKDIRMQDNKALSAASQKAKEGKGSLLTMYLFSPADMDWHGTSPARTDLILQSLGLLKEELAGKNIPLALVTAKERKEKVQDVLEFAKEHDVSHIYANIEYEVDELRRDCKLLRHLGDAGKDVLFTALHDQTVVKPSELKTGGGGPHKVFTPYHRAWLETVRKQPKLLETVPDPEGNDKSATQDFKKLFDSKVPELPESKQYASADDQKRIRKLWPAGHSAGMERLEHFLTKKVEDYAVTRSEPAKDSSSRLSAYFSTGIVSVREALSAAKKHNEGQHFDASDADPGIAAWVREIVFREFYRHMMVITPHNAMNLPQNLKFDNIQWEDDEEGWYKWCEGKLGVPFVDAGMRQLKAEAYMHNRLRMNTSSYLRTNLLLDYRRGERWFAENLVDWDLSNNTQGWEPSYTVFNPVSQAEKNDKDGDFIRKWVPELKDVKGKAVFAPDQRLSKAEFEKLGYPRPHVDFSESKDRALSRYKADLADADP
ncbi:MAG: hypothetical protein M1828_007563 [Chrysothrix sp. TS-e1954]|nr:MAG: hypothetical protein M1828_007563 [Chrysothrix sp. TS-e1954]